MTKDKLISIINETVDYLTNGSYKREDRVYNGHPAFYIKHSKEEFEKELNAIIEDKESYDRYDLYYYANRMFKYMLNEYDSHTQMLFNDYSFLPLKIRIIDNIPYVAGTSAKNSKFKGSRILKVNDIDVNTIISELEKIICYGSPSYLKVELEYRLHNANILRSLPIINSTAPIKITTDKGEIIFEENMSEEYYDETIKHNYNLEIYDNTAVITYNSCRNEDKMIELVEKLKNQNEIDNYIVDLRGNGGGNSSINRHLVEFLNGKNIIVLCDERVFSSARMCAIDLKRIGAKLIGTDPGTPISCFGNNVMNKTFDDLGLRATGSATYWYYDEDYNCYGVYKENFEDELKSNPRLLKPTFLHVDEKAILTLDDYVNNRDSVLDYALSLCSQKKVK